MPDPHPITLFRKVLDAARAGAPLPPDAAAFVLTAGDTYEAGNGRIKLDQAMGLSRAGGGGPWWVQEARERRNALLRQLRTDCYRTMRLPDAVDRILRLAEHRRRASTPPGTLHDELMDAALRVCPKFPDRKQLRGILGNPPP